tara:strand:+ start:680 stop:892 length:213 start_codon:yes stop_codon:yes gene_type:complete
MNCEIVNGCTILTKRKPVRGSKDKKYYEPLFGTEECTYLGRKRGRKSAKEKLGLQQNFMKVDKEVIIYFD